MTTTTYLLPFDDAGRRIDEATIDRLNRTITEALGLDEDRVVFCVGYTGPPILARDGTLFTLPNVRSNA